MRRRAFLAGVGAAGTAGLAGCGAVRDLAGDSGSDGTGSVDGVTLATIDARGSSEGEVTVPTTGSPMLVDLFATWCTPCKPTLDNLAAARGQVSESVVYVSATDEALTEDFTTEDIAAWWADHGGEWTVAHDEGSALRREVGATRNPTSVLFDTEGQEVWRHTGIPETETVVSEIEAVTG